MTNDTACQSRRVAVAASSRRRSQPSMPTASDTARWPTSSGDDFSLEQNVDCGCGGCGGCGADV